MIIIAIIVNIGIILSMKNMDVFSLFFFKKIFFFKNTLDTVASYWPTGRIKTAGFDHCKW